jgi:hypothetical protein
MRKDKRKVDKNNQIFSIDSYKFLAYKTTEYNFLYSLNIWEDSRNL